MPNPSDASFEFLARSVSAFFAWVLPALGLFVLIWRLGPRPALGRALGLARGRGENLLEPMGFADLEHLRRRVSLIVPARNEEEALKKLLPSLSALEALEIVVVNDASTDRTAEVAREFGVRVLEARPRPPGWTGKNWACAEGARAARGDFFLFTDADTVHDRPGFERALEFSEAHELGLTSALPYHLSETGWERLLGPFHLLTLLATAPLARPRTDRCFAIGQFLLFRRRTYEKIGGHEAIKSHLAEDLALAHRTLQSGERYGVFAGTEQGRRAYRVRMYDSFSSFCAGWRRNLRLGLKSSTPWAALEITSVYAALAAAFSPLLTARSIGLASMALFAWLGRRHGRFSILGALLFPFATGLFAWLSALAVYDQLRGRAIVWKERAYGPEVAEL